LRIIYLCKYFIPTSGISYGGRAYNLFLELSRINNVFIDVVASDSLGHLGSVELCERISKVKINSNYNISFINTYSYKKAKSIARIFSWIDFEIKAFKYFRSQISDYDIIYASSPSFLTLITGFILSKFYRKKFVIEIRDIWPLTLIEEGNFSKFNPLIIIMGIVETFLYMNSDLIIGTMPGIKEYIQNKRIIKHFNVNINAETIPFGINENIRNATEKHSPINLEDFLNERKFKIIYSGSVGISNALENFFDLARNFRDDESIQFFILGDGPLLEKYIAKTSGFKNIIFLGKVPAVEVDSIIRQADILYLASKPLSLWEYGQSLNKLVDYMYSGKVILFEFTGLLSMINEAKCGFVVSHNDPEHIKDVVNYIRKLNECERDLIGKRGRQWILKNRSYQNLANDLHKMLNKL
jgi:glycosyltransferase involved in cell wall biosynthesis